MIDGGSTAWVLAVDGATGPGSVGGWITNRLHALDFAGGTAVEINSGRRRWRSRSWSGAAAAGRARRCARTTCPPEVDR